jgi:hypothetical protein
MKVSKGNQFMKKIKEFIQKQKTEMTRINPGHTKKDLILGYIGIISGVISIISWARRMGKKRK